MFKILLINYSLALKHSGEFYLLLSLRSVLCDLPLLLEPLHLELMYRLKLRS